MDLYHVLSMIVIRVKHLVVGHACTRDKLNSTHQNVYFFFKVHLLIYISRQIVSLVFNIIFETAPPPPLRYFLTIDKGFDFKIWMKAMQHRPWLLLLLVVWSFRLKILLKQAICLVRWLNFITSHFFPPIPKFRICVKTLVADCDWGQTNTRLSQPLKTRTDNCALTKANYKIE